MELGDDQVLVVAVVADDRAAVGLALEVAHAVDLLLVALVLQLAVRFVELRAARRAAAVDGVEIEPRRAEVLQRRRIDRRRGGGLLIAGLRGLVDEAKQRVGSGVVALVAVNDGRATVAVGVTDDLTATRNAVDLVRKAVEAVGGQGGGGRPDMAQGGGPEGGKAE